MDFVTRTDAGEAIVRVSDDDLISIHACIREALEALSNGSEFRIRIGVAAEDVMDLMSRVRAVRAALADAARSESTGGGSEFDS